MNELVSNVYIHYIFIIYNNLNVTPNLHFSCDIYVSTQKLI
jgi:hypothetical protein